MSIDNFLGDVGDAGREVADDWLERLKKKQQRRLFGGDDDDDGVLSTTPPPPPESIEDLDYDGDWRLLCPMNDEEEVELRESIELSAENKNLFDCGAPAEEPVSTYRLERIGNPGTGVFRVTVRASAENLDYTVLILTAGEYGLKRLVRDAVSADGVRRARSIDGTFVASFFRTGRVAAPPYSHRGMVISVASHREGNILVLDRETMSAQGNFTAESFGPGQRGVAHVTAMVRYINFMTDYIYLAYVRYVAGYVRENSALLVEVRANDSRVQRMAEYEQALAQRGSLGSYLPDVPLFRGEFVRSDARSADDAPLTGKYNETLRYDVHSAKLAAFLQRKLRAAGATLRSTRFSRVRISVYATVGVLRQGPTKLPLHTYNGALFVRVVGGKLSVMFDVSSFSPRERGLGPLRGVLHHMFNQARDAKTQQFEPKNVLVNNGTE